MTYIPTPIPQDVKLPTSNTATFTSVTVSKTTAITLIPENLDRIGYSVYNSGNRDVLIRYKTAASDNNLDGFKLSGGSSRGFHDVNYTGEISSIRRNTTGTQTSDIKITEW